MTGMITPGGDDAGDTHEGPGRGCLAPRCTAPGRAVHRGDGVREADGGKPEEVGCDKMGVITEWNQRFILLQVL